jgi:hypothetical protein
LIDSSRNDDEDEKFLYLEVEFEIKKFSAWGLLPGTPLAL